MYAYDFVCEMVHITPTSGQPSHLIYSRSKLGSATVDTFTPINSEQAPTPAVLTLQC